MNQATKNDMVSFNFYCRNRLKKSLTYSICNGNFKNCRTLLESIAQSDESSININETDEWWNPDPVQNKNALRGKTAGLKPTIFNNYTNSEIEDLKIILPIVKTKITTNSPQYKKTVSRSALMLCSLIEDQEWGFTIMQNLIEKGAYLHLQDSNGHNAIMYTCLYQRPILLELILKASGDSNLYDQDMFGNTVFHLASLCSTDQNCKILYETWSKYQSDTSTKMIRNNLGHTPYDLCKANGHEYCVQFLYPGIYDSTRLTSLSRAQSTNLVRIEKNEEIEAEEEKGESHSPTADLAKQYTKATSTSFFATLLSIEEPSNVNNFNIGTKKNLLLNKASIQENYKPLFALKEPFIKKNTLYFNQLFESQKNFVDFSGSSGQSETNGIQLVTYRLIESNTATNKTNLSTTFTNFNNMEANKTSKPDSSGSRQKSSNESNIRNWKSNMKKILDVLESTKTRSFRATNKNLNTNLFDQIANGILTKVNQNSEPISRRNSKAQNSAASLAGDQARRQSIASSIGKGSKTSRRPSVTAL